MEVYSKTCERELTLTLSGDLDHPGAREAMTQIGHALDAALPLHLILDFSGVSFMDSSGIAVVLRTQKRMTAFGGTLCVSHIPAQAKKVFDAAGISRLIVMK